MSSTAFEPTAEGQLVWCRSDPALGIGIVTGLEYGRVNVRFLRLGEERVYTTRGESLIRRYVIEGGERVFYRGEEREVDEPVRVEEGLAVYRLSDGHEVLESELEPEVREIGAKARLAELSLVHPDVVRTRLRGLALSRLWPSPGVAASLGARAQWLPHQIDVASRALSSDPVRLLLADEVGLGKTVEAALIYAGLRHEGRAERVLILTPQSLTIQWLGEVFRKAHELLVFLDDERIEHSLIDFPDAGPFEGYRRVIMSIDRLAEDPDLATLAASTNWDLVIVDESHHLRWEPEHGGNAKYRLLEVLAEKATHLLLLTATPMALDPTEYHALLRLLDPVTFDDPAVFGQVRDRLTTIRRTAQLVSEALETKGKIDDQAASPLRELLSDDEDDLAAVEELISMAAGSEARSALGKEVLDALRHRHPIADYVVRNRRGPVGGLPERHPKVEMLEAPELQAHLIDVGESVMMDLADTIEDPVERYAVLGRTLRALWATPRALIDILHPISEGLAAELAPYVMDVVDAPGDEAGLPVADARLRWLVEFLRKTPEREKVLVFVESDIAVRALSDALAPFWGGEVAVFHRGLAPRDQDRQVAWFRDPLGPQVMLSTEAGGEGRNFQFCHKVVLYDLPWRPATVEQRIGRVDRVGQRNDVEVYVPCFAGGFEAAVLKVMQDSIGVLDETVGGIDHQLEFVAQRLGELIHQGASGEDWKNLFRETNTLVAETRSRIASAADPVLDHASFSVDRVGRLMDRVPENLEEQIESFVRGFADHSKLELHNREDIVHVEGAPGSVGSDVDYAATFSRSHALDHEDVEFLSFGHPLVEQALGWARDAEDVGACLGVMRGSREGAAFVWHFDIDIPEDAGALRKVFDDSLIELALNEAGEEEAGLEGLVLSDAFIQRMDPGPLKQAGTRWMRLVEQNFDSAEEQAKLIIESRRQEADLKIREQYAERRKLIVRSEARRALLGKTDPELQAHLLTALDAEEERLLESLERTRAKLVTATALRITKASAVTA